MKDKTIWYFGILMFAIGIFIGFNINIIIISL